MPLPGRRLRPQRSSPLATAMAVRTIEQAIADGNAMATQGVTDRATTRSRVTALELSQASNTTRLVALEARPVATTPTFFCTSGRTQLTGLRSVVTVLVTLTAPMPDTSYIATATLAAPVGLLTTAAAVTSIVAQTTTTVSVQVNLGAAAVVAGAYLNVVAVRG
jgi:hypothetical protein